MTDDSFDRIEDFAKIDKTRQQRTGFPEVIWGEGKTAAQISQIIAKMQEYTPVIMATRIDETKYLEIKANIPNLQYYPTARIAALTNSQISHHVSESSAHTITILAAGTADLPVAEEAAVTAELSGFQVERLLDVGVAGIHRLLSHHHLLERAEVIIVVAGMEGALVSVVAGMVRAPVIAVPTSIGYGANFGGVAALLTMLNSCATGVGTVNIDNGFGAAMLAGKMLLSKRDTDNIDRHILSKNIVTSPTFSHWHLAYSHDIEGKEKEGSIVHLLTAVRQGKQIKIAIEFPEGKEYITEVDNLWISNEIVCAQTQLKMQIEWRGDLMISQKKGDRLLLIASSKGDLEITRLSASKNKAKGRSYHRSSISWFVN
jgi:pyridinium-3,5-biscarboxylic acid mononucleotide synthase